MESGGACAIARKPRAGTLTAVKMCRGYRAWVRVSLTHCVCVPLGIIRYPTEITKNCQTQQRGLLYLQCSITDKLRGVFEFSKTGA